MRRSTVMRSRATDGMSAPECQRKRPDQAVKHRSDGRECREPSTLSHLGFQPVQKTSTIHVSSGFIWGIPVKTNGQARGARCVEGTGITDLRPLVDSLDTYARQIHSIAEIIRSIGEESAEQSTEAKAAENTAPCSLHDGQQHLTSTPVISDTLDRTPVIEAHAAPVVDTISPEAIWQRVSGARKATEARAIEWMPDKVYQDGCAAVGGGELDKLRAEFRAAGEKLREELRDALARLPVVDQEWRELERALNQSNLDARDERVAGAIEAATVKLRGELGDAGGKLRHELNAATSKLHDEINTRLAHLPLEVKTWEPVGEALDQIRQQAHEQARSELQAAVATLRDEFNAATSKLHNEINTGLARLPLVKTWEPDAVHYTSDVVVHEGSVYQARKDTGKEPGHQDWILLARAGRDGCDGLSPNVCGAFNAHEKYKRLDIVTCGRDADMDLAALRLSSGGWRTFPSTDELKTYVGVLTGDAPRQSNARLLPLVLAILVGVIGTLVILAVWLSPTPEQIQAARNGQGKQGTQQSTPAGDAQPSLLGQYGEYKQSASTPAFEQSAAARAPEQSTSTPASEQPRGWIAEVKKSRPICESADDYVQIQRMAFHIAQRPSRAAARKAAEFVRRKCPIITFKPGNHASVERTETFSIDKTRSITLACVVVKDGPCAWTDASALVRIPEEAPAKKSSVKNSEAIEWVE
jgi:hypothetical protein